MLPGLFSFYLLWISTILYLQSLLSVTQLVCWSNAWLLTQQQALLVHWTRRTQIIGCIQWIWNRLVTDLVASIVRGKYGKRLIFRLIFAYFFAWLILTREPVNFFRRCCVSTAQTVSNTFLTIFYVSMQIFGIKVPLEWYLAHYWAGNEEWFINATEMV